MRSVSGKPAVPSAPSAQTAPGPPPLRPFGLVLHHDGRFSHDGSPIRNRRLRALFDRAVEFLPDEGKYIVRLKHFRAQIEVEEAGFFVRSIDLAGGEITISDGTRERLEVSTLTESPIDGALLCRIKRERVAGGLPARFTHSAQAEFLLAIDSEADRYVVSMGGERVVVPEF